MKFRYIKSMHRELRSSCPDGYAVQIIREQRRLFTVITCEDGDYFAPWLIRPIIEKYGF